jgi:hypothetical protein
MRAALPSPGPAGVLGEGGQLLAERAGVLLVRVDLVLRAAAGQCCVDLPGRDGRSPGEVPCRQPGWSVVKCVCSRSRPAARLPAAAARHIAVPGGESSSVSVCAPQAARKRAAARRSADRALASHVSGRHSHVSGRHRPTPVIGFGLLTAALWSGWPDLNRRPLRPEGSARALDACASFALTLGHSAVTSVDVCQGPPQLSRS